jgi:hypothetical protein
MTDPRSRVPIMLTGMSLALTALSYAFQHLTPPDYLLWLANILIVLQLPAWILSAAISGNVHAPSDVMLYPLTFLVLLSYAWIAGSIARRFKRHEA